MTMFIPAAWTSNGKLFVVVVLLVVVAQPIWIYLAHRHHRKREELFRIIAEKAAGAGNRV